MTELLLTVIAAELGYIAYMMLAVLDATRGIKANGDASTQRNGGAGEE